MAGPPLSIADVLGRPAPAPRQPVTGRTISDILGEPVQAPAPVVRPRPQPRPAPVRSISDILGSPSPAPARPLGPPPVAPTRGLTTFDEGVQRGEAAYINGPELTPAPSPSPAQARRQPWQGPMVPKVRETRAQRAKRETEALERESAWSRIGTGPIASPLQNPVQSVSDILARPARWAGQALAQAQEVGSRTLAPVVNSILGDAAAQLTQKTAEGLSKVGEATLYSQVPAAGSRLFVPDGVDPQAWYETQQEYPQLGRPAQIRLAQERARANLLKTYQGEDILGPRSRELMQTSPTGQAIAKGEQAARADVAARPDENWAQSLTGLLKGVPGAYMFDEKAETMGQAALRRNPDAPIGAAALEMLAPNPLAMVPGASLARLDKLGKLGLAMRGAANLTGVATGVGSEIPVQLAKLAGKGLLKGVGQVGQAVERIGEGESTLARLARLASLPAGEARPGEIMALLRGLRNPAAPASVQEVLGRPAPDVAQLERLGDNAAANFQGNQRARPGMARLAQAEQAIAPPVRPVEAPPVIEPVPAALPAKPPEAPEPLLTPAAEVPAPAPVVRPPAEPRPADLGPGGETLETLSPHDLKADAKAYQFKSGGDFEGVTERLRDVRKWDRSKSGKAIVHERLNGDRYVADGHQRLGLARRLADQGQDPQIDALVFREAEGYTVEDMRVIAAAKNMAEDSGTAVDAAKIIKAYGIDSPHIDSIPRSSAVMRDGEQLAKLGDEAFEQVINGVIPQSHAAHVGRLISDPAEQAGAIRALARYAPESSSEALAIVNDIRVEGMATRTEQGGLFGPETFAEDLIGERGKIFAGTESLAKKDKTLFAAVVRGEKEFSQAGNVLAGDVNRAKITDAQRILAGLEEAKYRGPVNAKLNELARELKAGNTTVAAASRSFLETVRAESEVSAAAGLRGSGQAAAAAVPEPRPVEGFREPEPEPVPDIEGQDTLFSVPTGSRGRLASSPSTPANSPLPGPGPTPARLAGPAPATATAPAAPLDPKRSWWAKLWDKPREARVKSQMALTRELQDTLGMLARDEHLRPPSLFERAQSTLQGGTSPRVVYGPGSPTRPGGGAPQKATGAYHQGRDLLEVRDPGASGTVYHEAGHAIDTHTEFVKNAPPPIAAELERLGDPATPMPRTGGQSSWQPGMSKLRKRQEGMAEFLRLWMAHPDFDLAAQYPELSKAWESFLDGSNDVGRRLRRHQADMTVRLRSEDQALVRAQIVEENLTNSWGVNDALAAGFDRFRWMEALDSTLARNMGRSLTPDESVYVTTRMLAGLDSVMGSWIRGTPIGFNREAVAGAKSLESIFEPLADNPQQFLDFRDYLTARRADELHGRDMKSGMDTEGVKRVRDRLEAENPHFEGMAQDVYAWNDNILQYAADAGFLSETALKSIREMNQNYVPFHRIFETASQEFGMPKGTGGGLQASDTIKAIKGSNREIVDPIETMMANAAALISNAEKNRVGQALLQHWDQRSEGIGHFVREVSEPRRLVTADASDVIQVKQMREALEQAGVPTDGMSSEQLADLIDLLPQIKIFEKSGQLPANTVKVKVQVPQKVVDPVTGAETTTTVDRWRLVEMEPHLYTAFSALDEDQVHWAVNALSGVANLLRAGATKYSPVFIFNNSVRDAIEASTISRLGTRTSGALRPLEPLVHAAHGMRVVIGHSLAKFLQGGLTGALEEAGRFAGLPGKLPAGVRAVTDRIKMDAPAAVKRVDELMETFIREGGMQGMDDMLTSEAGTRAAYNRVFGRLNPKSKLLTYVPQGMRPYLQGAFDLATLPIRTPAAVIRILSEASEQMNRVSEFEKGLKVIAEANPTWTPAQVRRQAAFEARDLLDFSVRGSQVRAFRRMVPFLGSQMTGNYRVAKTVLEGVSQGRGWGSLGPSATRMFTQAAASITLPTMMLYAMNRNDADYNQLPQEERDTFWHLRVGKGTDDFLRIAKPHFLGATFASAPERFMQWGLQNDPDAFHGFLEAMVKHTMGPFGAPLQLAASDKPFAERFAGAADILGPAGKTLLELATNHDFFRNRDIEPKWNRDPDSSAYLPSYMRSDEYSSLVARTLARSPIGRAVGVSPLQLDHAMGNLAGTGGRLVVSAELDPLLAALGAGELPKAKTRKWGGLGYSESRYASEERLKREYTQTRDSEAEAMAKEQDLPPAQQDRIDLVRDTLKEVKDLRKQLREATGQEAADLRMEIRRITAAVTPPPGGRP